MKNDLDYLLSPKAIRDRSTKLFEATVAGKTHFEYHPDKLDSVVDFVVATIRKNYPDLKIPFHSRWGHFRAGGIDRVQTYLEEKIQALPREEQGRTKIDLVISSVLLDAGAGEGWKYLEAASGKTFSRSEGLGIASFWMFMDGTFSHDPAHPLRVTARGLKALTREKLESAFQVTAENPLVGVEGRLELLRSLGSAIESAPTIFPGARPGGLFDYLRTLGSEVAAVRLLRAVLDGLGPIWPGRTSLEGVNLGDCWRHSLLGPLESPSSLIPFHKLSQWLTYSLIEPIEEAGLKITGVYEMTGLPEYRNGGLLLDRELITLKDPGLLTREHTPDSELIVEWRALTIVCLDRIAERVRSQLGIAESDFPLAKVLEGGTWWAGRAAARELRADGSPPLKLKSDGTVF
ncbi:MAG: URC4/urg3 family protein [Cryobacterium sp.]|nr:URC4/urg3 family protein [Oligoflexia bacterium]